MKLMTLMAATALLAATHAIATRFSDREDDPALAQVASRIHDLPAVRVYADPAVKREVQPDPLQVALRVHDMPRVRVHAQAEDLAFYRQVAHRGKLAVPRASQRRGIRPVGAEEASPQEQLAYEPDCVRDAIDGVTVAGCRTDGVDREGYAVLSRGRLAGGRD